MLTVEARYIAPNEHGLSFTFPVVRFLKSNDKLVSASDFRDQPARLTEREAEFCKLLIDMARQLSSSKVPIIFDTEKGKMILDKGCIKFSEHRGFIKPLKNDDTGLVASIILNFNI